MVILKAASLTNLSRPDDKRYGALANLALQSYESEPHRELEMRKSVP